MNTLKKMTYAWIVLLVITVVACSKDNHTHDHNHEEVEWKKAEFTFRRGHLHGTNFHGNPESSLFPTQKYIFEKDEKGTIVRKDSNGNVLKAGENPLILQAEWQYALEIVYYNEKGERINNGFATAEAQPYHQHFFTVENYTETKTNVIKQGQEGLINYVYRDTNPEHIQKDMAIDPNDPRKGRSVLSENNLGLKGYFTPKIPYTKFDMRIRLLHITKGTKYVGNDKSKGTLPFNAPSDDLLSRSGIDFDALLPVHIFTIVSSGGEGEYDRYVQDLATFLGKTPAEVKELLAKAANESENSAYWM